MTEPLKVVNLYGGPGTGKSTTAAGLFFLMKIAGYNCELVREYAKDAVWEGRTHLFAQQAFIFTKQAKRLRDLEGKVDIVMTDSPLMMSLVYGTPPAGLTEMVAEERRRYNEFDVRLGRVKRYQQAGRTQTESEALDVDSVISHMQAWWHMRLMADERAPERIMDRLHTVRFLPEPS